MPPRSTSNLVPLIEHEIFSGSKDKDAKDSKNEHAGNTNQEWRVGNKEEYELIRKSKFMQHKKYSLTNSSIEPPCSSKGVII